MKISILRNNQKGITLTTLVITIILLLIIAGSLVYNSLTGANIRRLNRMYNDVELLTDKVTNYYAKYGAIPIMRDADGNIINISGIVTSNISKRDANDNENYYILELSDLSGISLNYGKDYDSINSLSDVNKDSDLYIINEQSHKIYYLKGVKFEESMYYTKEIDTQKVE